MATKKKTTKKKAATSHPQKCLYCGKILIPTKGKRAKKYCNDVCRSSHHQKTSRGTFDVKAGGSTRAISTDTNTQHLSPYLLSRQKSKQLGKK